MSSLVDFQSKYYKPPEEAARLPDPPAAGPTTPPALSDGPPTPPTATASPASSPPRPLGEGQEVEEEENQATNQITNQVKLKSSVKIYAQIQIAFLHDHVDSFILPVYTWALVFFLLCVWVEGLCFLASYFIPL